MPVIFQLYLVDAIGKELILIDYKELQELATLTTFYTGNAATGATIVIALHKSWLPVVYSLVGKLYFPLKIALF